MLLFVVIYTYFNFYCFLLNYFKAKKWKMQTNFCVKYRTNSGKLAKSSHSYHSAYSDRVKITMMIHRKIHQGQNNPYKSPNFVCRQYTNTPECNIHVFDPYRTMDGWRSSLLFPRSIMFGPAALRQYAAVQCSSPTLLLALYTSCVHCSTIHTSNLNQKEISYIKTGNTKLVQWKLINSS